MELPNEKQVSNLRRYFIEYTVLGLTAATVYLYVQVNSLNVYIRDKQSEIIMKNTETLEQIIKSNTLNLSK